MSSQQRYRRHKSAAPACSGCGGPPHDNRRMCKAWNRVCYKCQKLNHFANVCKANIQQTHLVENDTHSQSSDKLCEDTYTLGLYHTSATHTIPPYICNVQIEGSDMVLEIDTGSSVSLISGVEWAKMCQKAELTLDTHNVPRLRTYAGTTIEPLGRAYVNVCHNSQQHRLPAIIVPGSGPNLLGRDWLVVLKVNWAKVYQVDKVDFLKPYESVFNEGMGTLKGMKATFYVDDTVKPRFCKPRPVPFALRAKVEDELDRMQDAGIIRPVEFSEWAAPSVPVLKSTGAVRICGDYKVTTNRAVKVDKYPIPNVSDLLTQLSGGRVYTTLDMSHAYQQVVLDEESRPLTTINTSKGLFEFERLPFGVSSSPGIFQRIMEQLLQNIPMTVVYIIFSYHTLKIPNKVIHDHARMSL